MHAHATSPSEWVVAWASKIAAGGRVLDVACGRGRHARWLAERGYRVDALDRDAEALASFDGVAGVRTMCADIENGPWPCETGAYDAVVVTNYLHRPLFPDLIAALAPGGVLIYETFAVGHEQFGKPSNPAFLLQPGELLDRVRGKLKAIAYEDAWIMRNGGAVVQRICALR